MKRQTEPIGSESSNAIAGVQIRTNVVAGNFPIHNRLNRDHPLGGDPLSVQPHRDTRLAHLGASQISQLFGEGRLSFRDLNCLLKRSDTHMDVDYNTVSVIGVNTRSAIETRHTKPMPRQARTSDFWDRLVLARSTHKPPLSMRQEDIKAETGAAFQSTITKWKTGGPDGRTKPRPEIVERLAEDAGVSFDWLYTGRGEMRPRATPDPITQQIINAMDVLPPNSRLEVLKEAFTQQTLLHPAIAAQIREAHTAAEKLAKLSKKA